MDIYILAMRVTNNLWAENDIVDVFPITQAPDPGPYGQAKHAAIIVRKIPVTDTPRNFTRLKQLLSQHNYDVDEGDFNRTKLNVRRWFINRSELPPLKRNAIRRDGYVEITWSELLNSVWRKQQDIAPTRRLHLLDFNG